MKMVEYLVCNVAAMATKKARLDRAMAVKTVEHLVGSVAARIKGDAKKQTIKQNI